MKKSLIFCAIAALLIFSLSSCKQQERHLVRFSVVDSAQQFDNPSIFELVWENGQLQLARHNNPYATDRPRYEDYGAFFNYDASYTYDNGRIASITGNKYRSVFTYDNDNLVRVDQTSIEGNVLTYRAEFSYLDDNKVKASYYAMSHEAVHWLEAILYPRADSTGAPVVLPMPEDTSLALVSEALYQYQDGNLVSASATFIEGFKIESRMEYDNKINPLHNTYCEIDKQDAFPISLVFGNHDMGNSKNNMTKVVVKSWRTPDAEPDEVTFEYAYEYDGDYPILQTRLNNPNAPHRYEYDK